MNWALKARGDWKEKLSGVLRVREAHLFLAVGLTLVVLLWRAAVAIYFDPPILIILPIIAIVIVAVVVTVFCLGGIGWLVFKFAKMVVRWRAHEELREGMTRIQTAWVMALVIFLGVPEFSHAFVWWHEHLLRLIPGEENSIERATQFLERNGENFATLALGAALSCFFFWNLFSNFRAWCRRMTHHGSRLLHKRQWRLPFVLTGAIVGTGLLLSKYNTDVLAQLLSIEFIALSVWLFAPLILPNIIWLVWAAAVFIPSLIVHDRLGGHGYVAVIIVWGAWLFSILWERMLRVVYWPIVLGFLGYMAR